MAKEVENENCKTVEPINGESGRMLYLHQEDAMKALDKQDKKNFRSLVVLPTGGGKTLTATRWLLRTAVDNNKKVLWIAHRHLLLTQAAEAFVKNAFSDIMINKTAFRYRVVSGQHDKPVHIKKDDNVLIVGKDSLVCGLNKLDEWISGEDIYFVIDEAHHAVARSYQSIINYVDEKANSVKLLGLTATPFRTAKGEEGALKKIFTDDIAYKIDLMELIKRGILATPLPKRCETNVDLGRDLGVRDMQNIIKNDDLPDYIKEELANSKERNHLIVNEYVKNREEYGPTIVFAVNINQAIALNSLFNDNGVRSAYIISSVYDKNTGVKISDKENAENIEKYKNGELDVLVNVEILTEGTDLPRTHTVFLTRPTTSMVLMTQMVGRALRGPAAGGTKDAYLVSFVDNWDDKIAWVSPEELLDGPGDDPRETSRRASERNYVAIRLIEMFAKMADSTVDTTIIESFTSTEILPVGRYILSTDEFTHSILVYDATLETYEDLFKDLPNIFAEHGIDSEVIPEETLEEMVEECVESYFDSENLPFMFSKTDIKYLLMYYAEKPFIPELIPYDRASVDVKDVARKIFDDDMGPRAKTEYIRGLWDEENSVYRAFYTNITFFMNLIENELRKLSGIHPETTQTPRTTNEKVEISRYPLQWIIDNYPQYGLELRNKVYEKARTEDGGFKCAKCGKVFRTRISMQIDHIKAMANGGLTTEDNLQVLCKKCNGEKGDKE